MNSLIWRATGWYQIWACLLGLIIAFLTLLPIEIQRRAIDDAIGKRDIDLLVFLCLAFAGSVLAVQLGKFTLNSVQVWIGESLTRQLRKKVLLKTEGNETQKNAETVSLLVSEIEKFGEFAGEGPSQVFVDLGLLAGTTIYMFYVEPFIALFAFGLMLPQVIFTPLIQARLNRLMKKQVLLKRMLGNNVVNGKQERARLFTSRLFANKTIFAYLKFAMKAILNLLGALAPITILIVGGYLVINGQTTIGVLVAFLSGFSKISEPATGMITFYRNWAQANVQYDLIRTWLSRQHKG